MGSQFLNYKKQQKHKLQICQSTTSKSASSTTSTRSHVTPTNQLLTSELPSKLNPESKLVSRNSSSDENALCQWIWNPSLAGPVLKIWKKVAPPTGLIK